MIEESEWIDGDQFENLADIKYSSSVSDEIDKYDGIPIVYCCTDDVFNFFESLKTDKKIKLITHNSDNQIRDNEISKIPENIIHWYANNYIGSNEKITAIPTGLERVRWYPIKRYIMKKILNTEKLVKNEAYLCFSVLTNFDRAKIYKLFQNSPFVTTEFGFNSQNFQGFFENLYTHNYTIAPIGNATGHNDGDCAVGSHRFWEALYMGSIPIVLDLEGNRKYEDLPVLYVSKWEDITKKLLEDSLQNLAKKWENIKKLNFSYWKNKIYYD